MMPTPDNSFVRLPKKHSSGLKDLPDAELGRRIEAAQSAAGALLAGIVALLAFALLWVLVTSAIGRVLPWFAVLSGVPVGLAVRRLGRGLDWRFPAMAAFLALGAALLGNILIAAANTADEFGTSLLRIISNVTPMTWPVFFDEVMTGADYVFAATAAVIGAFLANRRLSRRQVFALRAWQDRRQSG